MSIERFETGPRMSRVVVHNGTVYLAGLTAEKTVGQSIAEQTREILERIDQLLAVGGTDKTKLLQAVIWLQDIRTVDEMNKVLGRLGGAERRPGPRLHRGAAAIAREGHRDPGGRRALAQFQEKWVPVFRSELRSRTGNSRKSGYRFFVRNCVHAQAIPGKYLRPFPRAPRRADHRSGSGRPASRRARRSSRCRRRAPAPARRCDGSSRPCSPSVTAPSARTSALWRLLGVDQRCAGGDQPAFDQRCEGHARRFARGHEWRERRRLAAARRPRCASRAALA